MNVDIQTDALPWNGYLCTLTRSGIVARLKRMLGEDRFVFCWTVGSNVAPYVEVRRLLNPTGNFVGFTALHSSIYVAFTDGLATDFPYSHHSQAEAATAEYSTHVSFSSNNTQCIFRTKDNYSTSTSHVCSFTPVPPIKIVYDDLLLAAAANRYLGEGAGRDLHKLSKQDRHELCALLATAIADDQPVVTSSAVKPSVNRRRFNFNREI